jgi:ribosomal protein S27AE
VENLNLVEPISAYHKFCPQCGSALFPISSDSRDKLNSEETKADKECHCCGKKFMVLFGC